MRCPANRTRAAFLCPWILLVSATECILAGGPDGGASATPCLRMESQPVVPGMPGCTKFVYLKNFCDVDVVAVVGRTQHLFTGTLREAFPVVVPAGEEQSVGCAWWSGAMAPSGHELLAARFFGEPSRPEKGERHGSIRR